MAYPPSSGVRRAGLLVAALAFLTAPLPAQAQWRLVEDLRIGGVEDGPASFNEIRDVQVDAKGRILVLDHQAQEIRMFSPDGRFVRLVGRVGSGPGEFRETNGLRIAPDGTIWVNDHENSRFVAFTADGERKREVRSNTTWFGYHWSAIIDAQGRIVEQVSRLGGPGVIGLRRFQPATDTWDTLLVPARPIETIDPSRWRWEYRGTSGGMMGTIPYATVPQFVLDPAGGAWRGGGESYIVRLDDFRRDAPVFQATRPTVRTPIPDAVREEAMAPFRKMAAERGITKPLFDPSRFPERFPQFTAINVDQQGRGWFRRPMPTGVAFDVWGRDGQLVATVSAPGVTHSDLVLIRGDRLYAVNKNDDDVPYVVRFRIVR